MKRLLILLTLVVFTLSVNAQRVYTFWGTAIDTLDASVVKTQVIPIGTNQYQDFVVSVFTDSVSGTPAFTAKIEYSLDGTNYFAILSAPDITHSGGLDKSLSWSGINTFTFTTAGDTTLTGDLVNHQIIVNTPVLAKFLKVTLTATGAAQQSLCYGYYIIKKH